MKKQSFSLLWVSAITILLSSCYSNKELLLDSALTGNCSKWEAKIDKPSFGPFSTITASYTNIPGQINVNNNLGLLIFSRNVTTEQKKFYLLQVVSGNDTSIAQFRIFSSTTERSPSVVRELFGKTKYTDYKTVDHSKNINGKITVKNKNIEWDFDLGICKNLWDCTSGYLRNNASPGRDDYLSVTRATKEEKRKGIIIRNSNRESVAALQLSGRKIVWMNNSMATKDQIIIATLFAIAIFTKGL